MKKLLSGIALLTAINTDAQLYIGSGTSLVVSGNTTLTLHDVGMINNGSFNAGVGLVRFAGMSHVDIQGTNPTAFYDVRLAKSLAGATVSLQQDIEVTNELTFGPGLLNLNDRFLDLSESGSIINEQENSRIITNGTGEVVARRTMNFPVNENPGNIGAVISASQNMGEVIVRRGHRSQTNGSGQGNSILRYYTIIPQSNNSLNATLRFQYFNAELNGLDENGLMMWSSPDNTTWTNRGYSSRDVSANYVELSGISSMMRFTLSSPANPLPVTGLLLSGRWMNDHAELKWTTETEFNNSHFDIQRRYQDQHDFYVTGRLYSLNSGGTSQTTSTYFYSDPASATRGTIFYRLEQSDLDGRISYSNTIALTPGNNKQFINYVSNAGTGSNSIFIQAGDMSLQSMEITIMDAAGKVYLHKRSAYTSQQLILPVMAPGVYYIRIDSGPHQFISTFIK